MGYYVDTTLVLHRKTIASKIPALLTEVFPESTDFPQQLNLVELNGAGGSKTYTGVVYAGALKISLDTIAEWFISLPWDAWDRATLTLDDSEQNATITVMDGRAFTVSAPSDSSDLSDEAELTTSDVPLKNLRPARR